MATSTVKWFSASKHYGFIAPDAGGRDVFVHKSMLVGSKLDALEDGARVSFDLELNEARPAAVNLVLLEKRASEQAHPGS